MNRNYAYNITGKNYHSETVNLFTECDMTDKDVAEEIRLDLRLRDVVITPVKAIPEWAITRQIIVKHEGSYTFKSDIQATK